MMPTTECENPWSTLALGVGARAHGFEPVHHVFQAIVVGLAGVGRRRAGGGDDLFPIGSRSDDGHALGMLRPFAFMAAAFFADGVQRGAFASIVGDSAIAAHDSGEAAEAIPEVDLECVEKAFGIGDGSDGGVGIFAAVFPRKDAAVGDDAFGAGFAGP